MIKNTGQIIAALALTNVATYISGVILLRELAREKTRYKKLHEAGMYLVTIIDENGIVLTEFDKVALRIITQGD